MPTLADYDDLRRRRFPDGMPKRAPAVTVVTVCRNAAATIERAIRSVHAQEGVEAEHVVVDGGSTDGTLERVRGLLRPGDYLVSEPDAGISDALNKGVALAAGAAIQFVHADDWLSPGQLVRGHDALIATGADFVFGDLLFHEADSPSFRFKGDPDYARVIDRRMPNLNHPTVLARKECFARIGLFDLRYRCAMDYDWFLRLHRAGGRGAHVATLCGNMSHDGVSNIRFARTMREVAMIAAEAGRPAWLAQGERLAQTGKIACGRVVKRHAAPLYRALRRRLNPTYEPLG